MVLGVVCFAACGGGGCTGGSGGGAGGGDGGGSGGGSFTDECTSLGGAVCSSARSYQLCAQLDSDSCLEWSTVTACGRTLARVEYYANDQKQGETTTSPHQFTYTVPTSAATNSTITLQAQAVDTLNARGYSNLATLSVKNDLPVATFNASVAGANIAQVDASAVSDTETPTSQLQVCWDWDNDNNWRHCVQHHQGGVAHLLGRGRVHHRHEGARRRGPDQPDHAHGHVPERAVHWRRDRDHHHLVRHHRRHR